MSWLSNFIRKHKDPISLVVQESEAIVSSGATGAHTIQALKNWTLGMALLELFDHLALHFPEVEPVANPAVDPVETEADHK